MASLCCFSDETAVQYYWVETMSPLWMLAAVRVVFEAVCVTV